MTLLPGFAASTRDVGDATYFVAEAGEGPPLLLLHGFPETHACWARVAPRLAKSHRVVLPDLRGYGASEAPAGGPEGEGYSKREMAAEMVELMRAAGHERFAIAGHDRGGRVAYRLALDHPDSVERLAIINVIPTVDQFERMSGGPSLGYWTWFFLAQQAPFPEELVGANPGAMLDHVFSTWASDSGAVPAESRAAYLAALTPSTIAAMCGDFRASFHADQIHDADDRATGRRIEAPTLAVAGADEAQLSDLPEIWSSWANEVTGATVPGGHFVPEESPRELGDALERFLRCVERYSGT
jgi:haloacetate dehalogenase